MKKVFLLFVGLIVIWGCSNNSQISQSKEQVSQLTWTLTGKDVQEALKLVEDLLK